MGIRKPFRCLMVGFHSFLHPKGSVLFPHLVLFPILQQPCLVYRAAAKDAIPSVVYRFSGYDKIGQRKDTRGEACGPKTRPPANHEAGDTPLVESNTRRHSFSNSFWVLRGDPLLWCPHTYRFNVRNRQSSVPLAAVCAHGRSSHSVICGSGLACLGHCETDGRKRTGHKNSLLTSRGKLVACVSLSLFSSTVTKREYGADGYLA